MRAYIINLKNRVDRWDSALSQLDNLGLPVTRVEACNSNDLKGRDSQFVAEGVAATWKSHQLAMQKFLDTSDEFGLIMEDDFLLTNSWESKKISQVLALNPDFVQFGYLVTSPIDWLELRVASFFDVFLKMLNRLCSYSSRINNSLGERRLVLEQEDVPWYLVANDIRAGGQAYLVSRKFAEASKYMNTPAFTSADGVFMSLGDVRSFRMYRWRKSLINQTNSPTSVEKRYI
jgi:GR25 family glycosyltransferase involved in LPS biosynthesis